MATALRLATLRTQVVSLAPTGLATTKATAACDIRRGFLPR
ncbi:MAG: hypothetical protein ACK501_11150 [Planctomycetota bacterium]|jgi:hypothetical protein